MFILDDPSKAYLWKGLEETGHASVQAINRAFELVSRDLYNFAQVQVPNPSGILYFFFVPFLLTFLMVLPCRHS
jgi:hypothetical protein